MNQAIATSLTALAIQLGNLALAWRIASHSWLGSLLLSTSKTIGACSGPSQMSARIALPAGRLPSSICHRLPCLSSISRFPNFSRREGPEVRKTSRVGTCVVNPSALAYAAPLDTTVSPLVDSIALTRASVEGGRTPKLP